MKLLGQGFQKLNSKQDGRTDRQTDATKLIATFLDGSNNNDTQCKAYK